MLRIIKSEIYLIFSNKKNISKLLISSLMISFLFVKVIQTQSINFPLFFYFGFFVTTSLIDILFYIEKIKGRFKYIIGEGFSLRQILIAKTFSIVFISFILSLIFILIPLFLANFMHIPITYNSSHLIIMLDIILYGFLLVFISGIIQLRFQYIFPVRLFNIFAFILFINYSSLVVDLYSEINRVIYINILLLAIILVSAKLAGYINKDKI